MVADVCLLGGQIELGGLEWLLLRDDARGHRAAADAVKLAAGLERLKVAADRHVETAKRVARSTTRMNPRSCTSPAIRRAGLIEVGQQLPPLPAVALAVTDKPGRLPWAVADADIDTGDRRGPRPRHTADDQLAGGDLRGAGRLGDD